MDDDREAGPLLMEGFRCWTRRDIEGTRQWLDKLAVEHGVRVEFHNVVPLDTAILAGDDAGSELEDK